MNLKYTNIDEIYCNFEFDEEKNTILIYNNEKIESIPYEVVPTLNSEYQPADFDMQLLENQTEDNSENSIFCVYADKIRVGWIFPIQALLSKEHEYADNIHFLKYAYVAICKLLDQIDEKNIHDFKTCFSLLDFYRPEQQVLLIDKENASKIVYYNIDNYVVSLFSKGYSFVGKGNIYTIIDKIDKNIRLVSLPSDLKEVSYINTLFKNLVPVEMEGFAKFHLLYQIIEIMITVVFKAEFLQFIEQLKKSSEKIFNEKENLDNIVGEKNRVKWLMNNYTSISQDKKDILNSYCIKILDINSCKYSDEEMSNNLYGVRCLIVHNLYVLDSYSYDEILPDLNNAFLDVIINMLQTFAIPSMEQKKSNNIIS